MSESETKPDANTPVPAATPENAAPAPVETKASIQPASAGIEQPADLLAAPGTGDTLPASAADGSSPAVSAVKPEPATPETTPAESAPAAAAPAPPSYGDAPGLPEGIAVTNPEIFAQKLSTFDAKLAGLETQFGISHEAAAAFRQEALRMAFDEIAAITRRSADAVTSAAAEARRQLDAERATQRQQWRQAFEDDPSLAGNNRDTTLFRANAVIDEYAADRTLPPAQRKAQTEAFKQALRESGLQNHPAMVRLLRNVGSDLVEGKPVPALKAPPPPKSKAQKLYR